MPEATYIPLDGSNSRSCGWWSSLTGLEKVLVFLCLILGIFVFALTIALVSSKGGTPVDPTTTSTSTSTTTTSEKPTTASTTTTSEKPPTSTTTTTSEQPPTSTTTTTSAPTTPSSTAPTSPKS